MTIISKRDQERIRRHQDETGETAKCIYGIPISREAWISILVKYQISRTPAEYDPDLNMSYWINPDETVRILSKGNPFTEKYPITEITVYAKPDVVDWIEKQIKP